MGQWFASPNRIAFRRAGFGPTYKCAIILSDTWGVCSWVWVRGEIGR